MDEQQNISVVREVYEAFLRKDLPAVLAHQAEDAEWSVAGPAEQIPWAAPRYGHEGVADFLRTLGHWLAAEQFEIRRYFADADQVVALGYQRGSVRPTGAAYEFDFVHVWTLRDQKITRFRVFYDTAYVAAVLRADAPA